MIPNSTAGFLPLSLNDYPGHVSAVIFFSGCNFFCPYCHNPELAQGRVLDEFWPLEEILRYIASHKKNLDGVVLTGGEPTLIKGLDLLIDELHSLGLHVKLDTNGSNPHMLENLSSIDFFALDIKTESSAYKKITNIPDCFTAVEGSLSFIRSSGKPYEIRVTCAPEFVTLENFETILSLLNPGETLRLQQYRNDITLNPLWALQNPPYPESMLRKFYMLAKDHGLQVSLR